MSAIHIHDNSIAAGPREVRIREMIARAAFVTIEAAVASAHMVKRTYLGHVTARELYALDDRTLEDIGVMRADIPEIARTFASRS